MKVSSEAVTSNGLRMFEHSLIFKASSANLLTVFPPSSVGGQVNLDEMRVLPGEGNGGPRDITRESENWRAAVFGRLGTTMDTASRIDQHTREQLAYMKKEIKHLRREVKHLMFVRRVPTETTVLTRRGVPIVEGEPAPTKLALLSERPKSLRALWAEWVVGINGRLPACKFTPQQSGDRRVKHTFCQRRPFWHCVERVVEERSIPAQTVIDMIDSIYKGSITQKLRKLKRDERLGGHYKLSPRGQGTGQDPEGRDNQ